MIPRTEIVMPIEPPVFRLRPLIRSLIWLLGLAGFLVPMVLARSSGHADLLRAFALGWFILFGVINAILVLREVAGRRGRD